MRRRRERWLEPPILHVTRCHANHFQEENPRLKLSSEERKKPVSYVTSIQHSGKEVPAGPSYLNDGILVHVRKGVLPTKRSCRACSGAQAKELWPMAISIASPGRPMLRRLPREPLGRSRSNEKQNTCARARGTLIDAPFREEKWSCLLDGTCVGVIRIMGSSVQRLGFRPSVGLKDRTILQFTPVLSLSLLLGFSDRWMGPQANIRPLCHSSCVLMARFSWESQWTTGVVTASRCVCVHAVSFQTFHFPSLVISTLGSPFPYGVSSGSPRPHLFRGPMHPCEHPFPKGQSVGVDRKGKDGLTPGPPFEAVGNGSGDVSGNRIFFEDNTMRDRVRMPPFRGYGASIRWAWDETGSRGLAMAFEEWSQVGRTLGLAAWHGDPHGAVRRVTHKVLFSMEGIRYLSLNLGQVPRFASIGPAPCLRSRAHCVWYNDTTAPLCVSGGGPPSLTLPHQAKYTLGQVCGCGVLFSFRWERVHPDEEPLVRPRIRTPVFPSDALLNSPLDLPTPCELTSCSRASGGIGPRVASLVCPPPLSSSG